jgi:hypothetical protein
MNMITLFKSITLTSHITGKTIDKLHEMGAINQLLTKQNDNLKKNKKFQKSMYVKEKGITLCEYQTFNQVKTCIVPSIPITIIIEISIGIITGLVEFSLPFVYILIDSND